MGMKIVLTLLALFLVVLAAGIVGMNFRFSANPVTSMNTFSLTSPVFKDGEMIPAKYTCDGERFLSPPLSIAHAPEGTQSFALLVEDPDIPQTFKDERGIDAFDHWVLYAIPANTTEIPEGGAVGAQGLNSANTSGYTGPCPPPEYEPTTHRYLFKLYALSGTLNFIKEPTASEVKGAIESMIIGEALLTGTYDRSGN